MKLYKCHKEVHAEPMTRGAYVKYAAAMDPDRSKELTHGGKDDEGYLVVYNKDTKDHYESWSPKRQFDAGYTEVVSG